MKYLAKIDVMPLPKLLDPQGKAVKQTLHNLKYQEISTVRIGKHIEMEIEANDEISAKRLVEEVSIKVLSNPVMEYFHINLEEIK